MPESRITKQPQLSSEYERIRTVVSRSARFLDRGHFDEFLGVFTAEGTYVLEARSSEIGKDMIWLALNKTELAALFKEYPQHVQDTASRTHLVTVDEIQVEATTAKAFSTFALFRTDIHGQSNIYALGSYEDELIIEDGDWKLTHRRVRVETRQFTTATHLPL